MRHAGQRKQTKLYLIDAGSTNEAQQGLGDRKASIRRMIVKRERECTKWEHDVIKGLIGHQRERAVTSATGVEAWRSIEVK